MYACIYVPSKPHAMIAKSVAVRANPIVRWIVSCKREHGLHILWSFPSCQFSGLVACDHCLRISDEALRGPRFTGDQGSDNRREKVQFF